MFMALYGQSDYWIVSSFRINEGLKYHDGPICVDLLFMLVKIYLVKVTGVINIFCAYFIQHEWYNYTYKMIVIF